MRRNATFSHSVPSGNSGAAMSALGGVLIKGCLNGAGVSATFLAERFIVPVPPGGDREDLFVPCPPGEMMRRLLVVGGVLAACLAVAATVALAATNTVTYDSKLSPAPPKPKAGKPANVGYEGILDVSNNGLQPASAPLTTIFFPKELNNNARGLSSPCTSAGSEGQPAIPAECSAAL